MSSRSIPAPSNEPKNNGDHEKSGGKEIKRPTRHIYSIDAHATNHHVAVVAGLDGRQVSENAKPDSECGENKRRDEP